MESIEITERVRHYIESRRDEIFQFIQEMVRIPSEFGEEYPIQKNIADRLDGMGLKVDMWEPDAKEVERNLDFPASFDENRFRGRPNVVGISKGKGGGRSLILQGHIDVEPAGKQGWRENPWSGRIEGNRLYGRGSNDMKGGVAAMIVALDAVLKTGVILKGDVIVQTVLEEEVSGAGALACLLRGYKADAAIIPEFTNCQIVVATEGLLTVDIKVKGRAAHASIGNLGVNAIEKAWIIFKAINDLEAYREKKANHPLYDPDRVSPFIPLKVTKMRGGVGKTIPGEATLQCRVGFLPDENPEDVFLEVHDCIMEAAEQDPWLSEHLPEIERVGPVFLPAEIDPDHPIVRSLKQSCRMVTETVPCVTGVAWFGDNRTLINRANIPTVLYGPGGEGAHGPDEYVSLDSVMEATKSIALTILDWCGFE